MTTLYIDGKPYTVSDVKPSSHGYSEVFVDNYSSCHLLPTELTRFNRGFKVRTGGHDYAFETERASGYAVIRADGFRQNYAYHAHAEAFSDAERMEGIRAVCKIMRNGDLGWVNVWANAFAGELEQLKAAHTGVTFRVI